MAADWYYEWTSVRGLLYQITWTEGGTKCRIRQSLNGLEINCAVGEELFAKIKDALPHRVDLFGRAKCNRLGEIASIEVDDVRILPDDTRTIEETPAIDITGGIASVEYVERLRGG